MGQTPPRPTRRMDVIVPARHAGRDLDLCLRQIDVSRGDLDVRIIVSIGEDGFEPPAGLRDVRVLAWPGADIFALRVQGAAAATAPIVAITEDHCQVAPTWCQAILDAFTDPDVEVVTGPVANGAPCGPAAWANYYANFAQLLPGRGEQQAWRPGGMGATTAWHRDAVDSPTDPARFHVEFLPQLARRRLLVAAGAGVTHWQRMRFLPVLAMQFHNARATGGHFRSVRPPRPPWSGFVRALLGNLRRTARAFVNACRHPAHRRHAILAAPAWWLITLIIAMGQGIGIARGPGDSAHKVP